MHSSPLLDWSSAARQTWPTPRRSPVRNPPGPLRPTCREQLNVRDVSSRYAQLAKGFVVERLDQFDADVGEWREALVEDRRLGRPRRRLPGSTWRPGFGLWLARSSGSPGRWPVAKQPVGGPEVRADGRPREPTAAGARSRGRNSKACRWGLTGLLFLRSRIF